MMKNFMTSGAPSWGRNPEGDLNVKDATPVPGEVVVVTILD
jgi:hypothetical protein